MNAVRCLTIAVALSLSVASACSDSGGDGDASGGASDAGSGGADAAAGPGDSGSEAAPEAAPPPVDAFNGDCKSARWMPVSDECWSCLCGACEKTLNACDQGCSDGVKCAFDEGTLVDVGADIPCEVRATLAECLTTPERQAGAGALIQFDTCLISSPKPNGFRVCEEICAVKYPGDVCERYPEPPAP
ncbi:MAG: hypothetical protein FJ104_03395 [Deltaproteobacteria bacterium]|nr:hypothetical protein [Deltaproteobacteria bacterium]